METQFIRLNMIPSGVIPIFNISQYDVGRMLGVYVYAGIRNVNLDNYTVTVEATRSDGTAIIVGVTTNNNVGTFEVTPVMSNLANSYRAQLVITDGNSKRIASLPFIINVIRAAMNENSEAIEEDATLYQQYTDAMQSTIAEIREDITDEATTRRNADNTLQSNIDAEARARQNADNTLQSNIDAEARARTQADAEINSRIDNILAPSGEAPSAAEVQDARVGADGVTYATLGAAIRGQFNEKVDKKTSKTPISGTKNDGKLWKVTSGTEYAITGFSYLLITSGFNTGDYLNVKGYQAGSPTNYPIIMFYDANSNLLEKISGTADTPADILCVVPSNTTSIYINGAQTGSNAPSCQKVTFLDYDIYSELDTIDSDITEIDNNIDLLSESKLEKEKIYTELDGTTDYGLWNYSTKEVLATQNFKYTIITSGFEVGDRVAITGVQAGGYSSYALCVFYDANMNQISKINPQGYEEFEKYEIFIPTGTAKIYINGLANNYTPTAYEVTFSDDTIQDILASNEAAHDMFNFEFENWMERRYRDGEYLQFTQKTLDHAIIAFCIDDSNTDVSSISDLFITKEVPLNLATIPSRLSIVCANGDTVLETCGKTVNNGGEILTHDFGPLGEDTTAQRYYEYFVTNKKRLEEAGLKIRGIVNAGGGTTTPNIETVLTYLRSFYDYGTGFYYTGITDARYNWERSPLNKTLTQLKTQIDNISNGGIIIFYGHGANDLGNDWVEKISELIDYIKTIDGAEIVTIGSIILNNFIPSFKQ